MSPGFLLVTPALFEEKAGRKAERLECTPRRKAGQTESNHHSNFRILIALRNGGYSVRPFNASFHPVPLSSPKKPQIPDHESPVAAIVGG
jgi:hypothetical protein